MYERQFKFVVDYDYLIKNYTYMYNYIYVKNVCYKVLLHLYSSQMFDSYDNINAQIHETDKIMNKYSLPLIKSILVNSLFLMIPMN